MTSAQEQRKGIDWTFGTEGNKEPSPIERIWLSRKWNGTTTLALFISCIAVMSCVFVIFRGYFANIDTRLERSFIVSLLELYVFLKIPLGRKKWTQSINGWFSVDVFLCLLVVITQIYTVWGVVEAPTSNLYFPFFPAVRIDHIVGIIVLLLCFEATRRSFGWTMVILPLIFIIYSLFGTYFPGPLQAVSTTWQHLSEIMYVLNEGVYGDGADVLLGMIFIYVLFGTFVSASKTGAFFTAAADSLVGRFTGGPAKVAIIGSALMGMITGSAIANVVTVGSVTIPLMKKMGFKADFAGAVETCASTAGYFTPPIMGAAAFLIAIFTNTPYGLVCLYCAIPALLYYVALFLQVHFRAKKDHILGLPQSQLPSFRKVMTQGGYLIIPMVILIVALGLGFSVTRVAIWGILAVIIVSMFRKETRMSPKNILVAMDGMIASNIGVLMSIVICGVIQGALMVTGLGFRLSGLVEIMANGSLVVGLIWAALISLILGTGLPSVLVYYICVAFIIPALVALGGPVLPSHIFALMFGAMAMITPPVAVAAFTAASISGADPQRTGWVATRLGFAGYLVPFMGVFNPAIMLLKGPWWITLISVLVAVVSLAAISAGFEGYVVKRALWFERVLLMLGGLILIAFQYFIGLSQYTLAIVSLAGGLFILAASLASQRYLTRKTV